MLNSNIRVDLHIHSKISEYKDGPIVEESIFDNIDILLSKLNEHEISLFGFSDHNRFDSDLFIKTRNVINLDANKTKYHKVINILPVVEFDVIFEVGKKKCHVLTVFDHKTDKDLKNLEKEINLRLLRNKEDAYTKEQFEDLLRVVNKDVILIAAQRKALDNPNGSKNSLSDSVSDVYEFLKVGYFNALEIQKSAVQGMILKNLVDFPKTISFTSGSDCHQWNVYPKHDEKERMDNKSHYFIIKAMPTFSGLVMALTSPETRFGRSDHVDYSFIESITLNNEVIKLSSGINTIIGENGSGKSSIIYGILNETKTGKGAYAKKILEKNSFVVEPDNLFNQMHGIKQSEIIDNYNDGFVFGKSEEYFNVVDHKDFEDSVNKYAKKIFNNITNNINLEISSEILKESSFTIDLDFEDRKQYYFQIVAEDNFVDGDNVHEERLKSLNKILKDIKTEYEEEYYTTAQKEFISKVFNDLISLRNEVKAQYIDIKATISAKNLIVNQINDYELEIASLSGEEDKRISKYNLGKTKFKGLIISHIDILKLSQWTTTEISEKFNGQSFKPYRGYTFVKKAKYVSEDVLSKYFEKVFKKDYRSIDKLKNINSVSMFADAIFGANTSNYKQIYYDKVTSLIIDLKVEEGYITKEDGSTNVGNTLGERSLVFYDFIVHNENKKPILIIDQPEDNISNTKILNNLVKKLSLLRDRKQIIIVTHNPILVVNLDADNVIHLNNLNNEIKHQSGCLEAKGIIDLVAKTMDGGVEAIERRYKIYGRK
jgi:predicted ATPase